MAGNREAGTRRRLDSSRRIRGTRARAARGAESRGVILLVVLVLLALFTMLLITFVVATVNNRQGVIHSSKVEQTGDSPQTQMHNALLQIIRGPRDANSVIGPHSLLEDAYGHFGATAQRRRGKIHYRDPSGNRFNDAAGNPIDMPFLKHSGNDTPILQFVSSGFISDTDGLNIPGGIPNTEPATPFGYYAGRVITMIDGPAAGRSSRIVGYRQIFNGGSVPRNYFQVLGFDGATPNDGDTFVINGRAFSGMGFGYQSKSFTTQGTRLLDAFEPNTNFLYALLPNTRRGVFVPNPDISYFDPAGPGGANEDYDIPDFQNMLLAMQCWAVPPGEGSYRLLTALPSLHRPDLISYWNQQWKTNFSAFNKPLLDSPSDANPIVQGDATSSIDASHFQNWLKARRLLRRISLRPLSFPDDPTTVDVDESENPNFTGSNPAGRFNPLIGQAYDTNNDGTADKIPVLGPWDVDNDGDGTPDSVWVDLGFPVQTMPDGRRYKPLFAVLVVDQDGKLNVNAHSSWRHTPSTTAGVPSRFNPIKGPFGQTSGNLQNPQPIYLKFGSGYGPGEISLHSIFEPGLDASGNPFSPTGELAALLGGDTSKLINGRYGEIEIAGSLGKLPGAGITAVDDPIGWLRELNYPQIIGMGTTNNYPHRAMNNLPTVNSFGPFTLDLTNWKRSGFGTPNDLDGDGMLGLDLRGQPVYVDWGLQAANSTPGFAAWGEHDDTVDDPYELDLSLYAQNDGYSGTVGTTLQNFASNQLAQGNYSSNSVTVDAPFQPAELERILRARDIDASGLPDRLTRLAPKALVNPAPMSAFSGTTPSGMTNTRFPFYPELAQLPAVMTTHSFDMPGASMVFTSPDQITLTNGALFNNHLTEYLRRVLFNNGAGIKVGIDFAITQLLAPEVIAGEKMNLNRILGNGQDDNGDMGYAVHQGRVDEAGEGEKAWGALNALTDTAFDLNNDGNSDVFDPADSTLSTLKLDTNNDNKIDRNDTSFLQARQLLARHLYVLMMLLKDPNFQVAADVNGDGNPAAPGTVASGKNNIDADVAYYFAQWAVNIVDFYDADSTMTGFEFDIYPFGDNDAAVPGTWDVDGFLATSTGITPIVSNDDGVPYRTNASHDGAGVLIEYRGVVWGCERPELLITETLATHDRRTMDTNKDSPAQFVDRGGTPKDDDFDQVRRPQGTLLVEVYNPNPPLAISNHIGGQAPSELYAQNGTDAAGAPLYGLDLGRTAPATVNPPKRSGASSPVRGAPVWRLATLSRQAAAKILPPPTGGNANPLPPRLSVLPYRDPPKTGPIHPFPLPQITTAMMPIIDRVAYFTPQGTAETIPGIDTTNNTDGSPQPTLDVETWQQFFPQSTATTIVPPNTYAVIGAAQPEHYAPAGAPTGLAVGIGARKFDADTPDTTTYPTAIKNKYYRRVVLAGNASVYNDSLQKSFGEYAFTDRIKPAIAIPMASNYYGAGAMIWSNQLAQPALTYSNSPKTIYRSVRFSLSEPSRGYPVASGTQLGGQPDYDENGFYEPTSVKDTPYDTDTTASGPFTSSIDPNDAQRQNDISDLSNQGANADQTLLNYTIVYLQRLADPGRPWDANANPYIIVDQMCVDLTTFNSEKYKKLTGSTETKEFTNSPAVAATTAFKLDSRQRSPVTTLAQAPTGPVTTAQPTLTTNNIWYPYGQQPYAASIADAANGSTSQGPIHSSTLGYGNFQYGDYLNTWPRLKSGDFTLDDPALNTQEYIGDPSIPYPWLNWNNRPFISAKELMLVPLGSPASMLTEMTVGLTTMQTLLGAKGAYEPTSATPLADGMPKGEFGHLPNMFHSPMYSVNPAIPNSPTFTNTSHSTTRTNPSANLHRLFEYVHVPSRFAGTETWLPPNKMADNPATAGNLPIHQLHPPFNRVSRFRDPGRVNINTIYDPFVWQGIVDEGKTALVNSPPWRSLWDRVVASRFGASTTQQPLDTFTGGYLNVQGFVTPPPQPMPSIFANPFRSYAGHTLVPLDSMRRHPQGLTDEREVDATLLRGSSQLASYPLGEYPGATGYTWQENGSNTAADDPTQNPYFAYRAFRRLDNLLTTRSNVYAIWITTGNFEVTPAPSNDPERSAKYPDGWVLGQEIGADTGEIKRHRSFYMYDRSIPVGFERGENHNVHRGILLERFIE